MRNLYSGCESYERADRLDGFYRQYMNPYLNYHRPGAQADVEIDEKGRKRVRYKRYQTPPEALLTLDNPAQFLRCGLSIDAPKRIAGLEKFQRRVPEVAMLLDRKSVV